MLYSKKCDFLLLSYHDERYVHCMLTAGSSVLLALYKGGLTNYAHDVRVQAVTNIASCELI